MRNSVRDPSPAGQQDRHITLGCVVVDPAFFDMVVLPTLGAGRSLVYILPEREPVLAVAAR